MLKTLVVPEWRSRKVADITPTDVDRLLTKIAAGRPRVWKKAAKPIKVPRTLKPARSESRVARPSNMTSAATNDETGLRLCLVV